MEGNLSAGNDILDGDWLGRQFHGPSGVHEIIPPLTAVIAVIMMGTLA